MQKFFTCLSLIAIVFVSIASSVHAESYVEHHVDHVQHSDHDHGEHGHEPCESSCSTNSCVHSLLLLSSSTLDDFFLKPSQLENLNAEKLASGPLTGLFKPPIS